MSTEDPELPLHEELARRLDLLTQTPGAVLKYDTNGDGMLDGAEWEMLRSLVEAQIVRERSGEDEDDGDWTVDEELEDPNVDLPVLEVIDARYEVLRELGRGSQGKTLLARRREDSHYVAVKELSFDNLESWKSLELFDREADVLRSLEHELIPSFVDSFSVDIDGEPSRFFLVQTFVSGSSLDVLMARRERISERQVLEFAHGVLEVLDYLHHQVPPIIHRDVKPANLIRQPDGRYALVDFGGAQVVLPSDIGGSTIIGTTGYMPPEQLTGRACPESDLYALGATMVHLVTHVSPSQLPTKRLKLDWRDRAGLTAPVADFIDRLIEPVVEDRYPSARDALRQVGILSGEGTSTALVQPMPGVSRTVEELARRKSEFLAANEVPRAIRRRRTQEGNVTVFDLSRRASPPLFVGGIVLMATSVIVVITFGMGLVAPAIVSLLAGVVCAIGGSYESNEVLRIWPDGRFEIRRGTDEQPTVESGALQTISIGSDAVEIRCTEQLTYDVGGNVSARIREWIAQDLRRELATQAAHDD